MLRHLLATLAGVTLAAFAGGCRGGAASDQLVEGGKAYLAQCAICHGTLGAGDGPLAESIVAEGHARPARLNDTMRIGDLGREGVRLAIEGRAHARNRSPMPVWGPHLGPPWMDRIAGYVATLPASGATIRSAVERYLAAPPGTPPEGRRTYVLYCSGCHGPEGRGDGFYSEAVSRRMKPAVLEGALLAPLSDAELESRIGLGGAHAAEAATMPGWIHTIPPGQRRALAGYLRTLGAGGTPR